MTENIEPKPLRGRVTPHEVRRAIHQICASYNYNPFEELIKLATQKMKVKVGEEYTEVPICDVDQRISIAKELAPYLAPKLKNLEVSHEIDSAADKGVTITVINLGDTQPSEKEKALVEKTRHLLPSGVTS